MIEVGGFIHQLDVCETDKKHDDSDTILIAQGHKKCTESAKEEKVVGIRADGLHPLETIIRKEKRRLNV